MDKIDRLVSKKMDSHLPEVKDYSHEQLLEMAGIYNKSRLAPPHLQTPEAIYIAMRWALALKCDPFLGLRDIFVIDNIPSLRTEAAIALVESSGFCEHFEQYFEGNFADDTFTAVCKVKRKGRNEHISKFSVRDAKIAKLWGKKTKNGLDTAWCTYPKRMLMYRAVGFAIRDVFPDVLRGSRLYEEVADYAQYEIVNDSSSPDRNVRVVKKGGSGLSKVRETMNEEPPID